MFVAGSPFVSGTLSFSIVPEVVLDQMSSYARIASMSGEQTPATSRHANVQVRNK